MTDRKPDRLSALIRRFRVAAKVYPVEAASVADAEDPTRFANLFIVRQGRLDVDADGKGPAARIRGPALVYWPRGAPRGLAIRPDSGGTEFVSASVDTGGGGNPIALALPDLVTVPLDEAAPLQAVADLLLEEALSPRCGGGAVIDRLCEVVVIRLLRHLIEAGEAQTGLLAGLAHPNLSLAIVAIHEAPERPWRLEELAEVAAMSRTSFATTFRAVVGMTPGEYLSNWRLTLARIEIARRTPLKLVARKVGFSGPAALSRAFSRRYGHSPRQGRTPAGAGGDDRQASAV